MTLLTAEDVRTRLKAACQDAGGQAAWGKAHRVSGAYVNDIIHGRRDPGSLVLGPLGLRQVERLYAPADETWHPEHAYDAAALSRED
ncbi:transcriptional regulator [Microvirga sp. Mcv34]|uniref:transcriptional regulator n=1 Tax=Microvirga sp. Mcv34 TaxID=2926016 RepID=UPI0021C73A79|nr:transcriptional regulator [Microvirga sp. Mcv34]